MIPQSAPLRDLLSQRLQKKTSLHNVINQRKYAGIKLFG